MNTKLGLKKILKMYKFVFKESITGKEKIIKLNVYRNGTRKTTNHVSYVFLVNEDDLNWFFGCIVLLKPAMPV